MPNTLKSTLRTTILAMTSALLIAAPAASFGGDLSTVDVTGKLPTSARVTLAGKDATTVRREIRTVSAQVCYNAVSNGEVELLDASWCTDRTNDKALAQYRAIVRRAGGGANLASLAFNITP